MRANNLISRTIAIGLIAAAIIASGCSQSTNTPPAQTVVAAAPTQQAPVTAAAHPAPTPEQAKAMQGSYMLRQSEYWLAREHRLAPSTKKNEAAKKSAKQQALRLQSS